MEKPKILAWCDYCSSTGFATVASNIWRNLVATNKYDLDVVGINYGGDPYDRELFPGNVYTAMSALNLQPPYNEPYGRQKLLDIIGSNKYDLIWLLQDTFILYTIVPQIKEYQQGLTKKFRTMYYYPLDAVPKKAWIDDVVAKMDFPVAYTNYCYEETIKVNPQLKNKLSTIYHGHNFDDIYYQKDREIVKQFRETAFRGETDNKFLIVNLNRNQRRKDIARTFMVFKELKDRGHKDFILYLHMAVNDIGGNLIDMGEAAGCEFGKDFILPENFDVNKGYPVNIVNLIYNAADAYLTTTHGEGWGLGITEAMATKTPVVAPNNTSITEILGDNRGYLIDSGANESMWVVKEHDNERLRPLMDVKQAADALLEIKNGNPPDIEGAYKWVEELSWQDISKQWETLIDKALATSMDNMAFGGNREQRRKAARQK